VLHLKTFFHFELGFVNASTNLPRISEPDNSIILYFHIQNWKPNLWTDRFSIIER